MATDEELLLIRIEATQTKMEKELNKALNNLSSAEKKIAREQAAITRTLEQNWRRFGQNFVGYLSVGAVVSFGRTLLNAADALSDTSQQLGLTTQELQGLDYAARVSGASSEKLGQALGFLTDGLGEAQKGEGELAKFMREKNIAMGDTIDVLYDIADRVKAATTQQEKLNIATEAFGSKAGKTMVSFLNEGREGLRRLQEEAADKNQIWDPATLARIDSAKDSFETLQKVFVNIAALPAGAFMTDLAKVLDMLASGEWERGLESLNRMAPAIAGAAAGGLAFGPVGAVAGGVAGYAAGSMVKPGRKTFPLDDGAGSGGRNRSAVPLSKGDAAAAALAEARRVQEIGQILNGVYTDLTRAKDSYTETVQDGVRSEQQDLIDLSQDWSDFAEVHQEAIRRIADADLASSQTRMEAELQVLEQQQFNDLQRLIDLKATNEQIVQLQQQYEEQRNLIVSQAAAEATEIRRREAADIASIQTNEIQLANAMRDGMLEFGTAALRGFGAMKDAAAAALDQIAQMILQMYVLKPLVESLLGKPGTSGGGILNSAASSIGDWVSNLFAAGGYTGPGPVNKPAGVVHAGEVVFSQADIARLGGVDNVEALRKGFTMPSIPSISRGAQPITLRSEFAIHVTGTTDKELLAQMNEGVRTAFKEYDRQLPSKVAYLRQNDLVR